MHPARRDALAHFLATDAKHPPGPAASVLEPAILRIATWHSGSAAASTTPRVAAQPATPSAQAAEPPAAAASASSHEDPGRSPPAQPSAAPDAEASVQLQVGHRDACVARGEAPGAEGSMKHKLRGLAAYVRCGMPACDVTQLVYCWV